jgi:hypothetical protein
MQSNLVHQWINSELLLRVKSAAAWPLQARQASCAVVFGKPLSKCLKVYDKNGRSVKSMQNQINRDAANAKPGQFDVWHFCPSHSRWHEPSPVARCT